MNKKTYYLIADIIQRYRTWIIVKDTEQLIEMRILQDGVLKPLFYKGLSLQSYRDHYSFRVEKGTLTRRDVEYIIEKASFGIIKLELSDYEY